MWSQPDRPWFRLCVGLVGCMVLAGCVAAPQTDSRQPQVQVSASVPPGGRSLAEAGFTHGPRYALSIPAQSRITFSTDQANVITVVFGSPSPAELAGYYRSTLPGGGFTITTDADDALIFTGNGWTGAFTPGADGTAALTLRGPQG